MSKELSNAKKKAYAKKQEEQGKKVVNAIFIALAVLALIFMGYSIWLVG